MKKTKISRINELQLDVVEYMFIEWLCRRGAFSAFRSNYEPRELSDASFRSALREQIRFVLSTDRLGLGDLVSSSFPFHAATEGFVFWAEASAAWRRFCVDFQKSL